MHHYGATQIADAFRTVRNNTLLIASEIPEDQYSFSAAEGTRTVAQTLIHISNLHRFQFACHKDNILTTLEGFNFPAFIGPIAASEQVPMSKHEIMERLKTSGEEFENWVRTLSDEFLAQVVTMPPGGTPPSRTRFDMLISVKEHEMHHRGQLMMMQRLIGLVPHLTRAAQARFAAMQQAKQ